jgi:Tfp pilus assembly protein PilN
MIALTRSRAVQLGVSIATDRVVVAHVASGVAARTWSRAIAPASDPLLPWQPHVDALVEALHEALATLGAGRARLSVALLPPLAESRFVELPGLRDDELQRVLARDASSYFPTGVVTPVVAAARRRGRGTSVIATASASGLVDVVYAAATAAGCAVDGVIPAHAAWARAIAHAWRLPATGGRCRLVVLLDGRVEVLTVDGGAMVALRRLPAAADHRFVFAALDEGTDADDATVPVALAGAPAAIASLAGMLVARGRTLVEPVGDTPPDPIVLAAIDATRVTGAPILMPEAVRVERHAHAIRGALRRVAAAALLLATTAGVGLWDTARERDAVRARRLELRAQLAGVLATRDTLAQLTERLATLRAAESGRRRWSHAIGLLASSLPRDAYLLSLRAEGDSMVVEGVARRAAPVLDALGRDTAVLAVRAQGSIRQEIREDAGQVERYTLSVQLMPGGAP